MTFETQRFALTSVRDQLSAQAQRLENLSRKNGNKQQKKVLTSLAKQVSEVVATIDTFEVQPRESVK